MDHERFGGFLECLYGLALPAQGVAVDGEEGETDFADLFLVSMASIALDNGGWGDLRGGRMGV